MIYYVYFYTLHFLALFSEKKFGSQTIIHYRLSVIQLSFVFSVAPCLVLFFTWFTRYCFILFITYDYFLAIFHTLIELITVFMCDYCCEWNKTLTTDKNWKLLSSFYASKTTSFYLALFKHSLTLDLLQQFFSVSLALPTTFSYTYLHYLLPFLTTSFPHIKNLSQILNHICVLYLLTLCFGIVLFALGNNLFISESVLPFPLVQVPFCFLLED